MTKYTLIGLILLAIFALAGIAFGVWFSITWGNTPISELPAWLWWLVSK